MQTRIFIVRHGETEHNRDGIVSGYYDDSKLTKKGIEQAQRTKELLKDIEFDAVYSSDLQRAVNTAEIVSGQKVHPKRQHERLRERDFGTVDSQPSEELNKIDATNEREYTSLDHKGRWDFKRKADIESDHELAMRFIQVLENIAQTESGKTILVGTHGGTIRIMLIELGYATLDTLPSGSVANAAYAELVYEDQKFTVLSTHDIKRME